MSSRAFLHGFSSASSRQPLPNAPKSREHSMLLPGANAVTETFHGKSYLARTAERADADTLYSEKGKSNLCNPIEHRWYEVAPTLQPVGFSAASLTKLLHLEC